MKEDAPFLSILLFCCKLVGLLPITHTYAKVAYTCYTSNERGSKHMIMTQIFSTG